MTNRPIPAGLDQKITALLTHAGVDAKPDLLTTCTQGANNRTYRVDTKAGAFAVKQYFRHDDDTRDRLATEFSFLTYAHQAAPGMSPRPLACDAMSGITLCEFIEGQPFQTGNIGATEVGAALHFFRSLNRAPSELTCDLPVAADACFTITDHIALVDARVSRLLDATSSDATDFDASRFVRRLSTVWKKVSEQALSEAELLGLDANAALLHIQRCISPSDFGFHNALRASDGTIRFLDFEYAGWDDPAKTAGDFFQQLAVPVPPQYRQHFATEIARCLHDPTATLARIELLRPVYAVKWCCIVLNIYLPVHLARRRFATPGLDESALKRSQLTKAIAILESLNSTTTQSGDH
jgi:hypothetical protein